MAKRTYIEVHHALNTDSAADGVAPAAQGKWIYDNSRGAWVLSYNTLPYVPVEHIETRDAIPWPVQTNTGASVANRTPGTSFLGGMYQLLRPVRFNRLGINFSSVTAPVTVRTLLYQRSNGDVGTSVPLVATCDVSPGASGRQNVTPSGGAPVLLVRGYFWLLIGINSGNTATYSAYNVTSMPVLNMNLVATDAPTNFSTGISAATAPATINPIAFSGQGDNNMPIIRLVTL